MTRFVLFSRVSYRRLPVPACRGVLDTISQREPVLGSVSPNLRKFVDTLTWNQLAL